LSSQKLYIYDSREIKHDLELINLLFAHYIYYSTDVIVCQCRVILWKAWYWDSWPQWLSFNDKI